MSYLGNQELDLLNRLVTMCLEFAELQAIRRKPMMMQGWIKKLDDFLRTTDYAVLNHAGTVSSEDAVDKSKRLAKVKKGGKP